MAHLVPIQVGSFFVLFFQKRKGVTYMYNNFSPYGFQRQEQVVRVNGRPGAETYAIGPNSSALLLDESGTIVWLVTTDGAGYKTVAPYDITPHQTPAAPDFSSLEERIKKLEERFNATADSATA